MRQRSERGGNPVVSGTRDLRQPSNLFIAEARSRSRIVGKGDSQLVATLREHGLSRAGARAVERLGKQLLPPTRRRDLEHAVMIDAESGEQVEKVLTGAVNEVDISLHLNTIARRPDRRFVQVHTHPLSSAFSEWDAAVFGDHGGILAMAVVGVDGTWYLLSETATGTLSRGREAASMLYRAVADEWDRLEPFYDGYADKYGVSSQEAQRLHSHAVWTGFEGTVDLAPSEGMARAFGLRYDRLRGDERG